MLLLDEAISGLNVVTERSIEQNIRQLACTQIIIAHRLSAMRDADVILVLHAGTMVEHGTHQQLLEQNGYCRELIRNRLSKKDQAT